MSNNHDLVRSIRTRAATVAKPSRCARRLSRWQPSAQQPPPRSSVVVWPTPMAACGTASRSVSRPTTGASTPATVSPVVCSSPTRPGGHMAARSTRRRPTRPASSSRSPLRSACWRPGRRRVAGVLGAGGPVQLQRRRVEHRGKRADAEPARPAAGRRAGGSAARDRSGASTPTAPTPTPIQSLASLGGKITGSSYVVQLGDTLSKIGQRRT